MDSKQKNCLYEVSKLKYGFKNQTEERIGKGSDSGITGPTGGRIGDVINI